MYYCFTMKFKLNINYNLRTTKYFCDCALNPQSPD